MTAMPCPFVLTLFTPILITVVTAIPNAQIVVHDTSVCKEDGRLFPQIVQLSKDNIRLDPPNPQIPGCFKIKTNVTISAPLDYLAAEVEMQLVDWDSNPLPCQREDKACGGEGSCNICNFCKGLEKVGAAISSGASRSSNSSTNGPRGRATIKTSTAGSRASTTRKSVPAATTPASQDDEQCTIVPGLYELSAELCTPDAKTIAEYLPVDLLERNLQRAEFSLFTTIWLIKRKYRYFNPNMDFETRRRIMRRDWISHRDEWVAGCYRFSANIVY